MTSEMPARSEFAKVREALLAPKRDWRFWAAVCAAFLAFTTTVAFTQILSDRNHWRDRFDQQSDEQLCRSVASAGVQQGQATLLGQMARNQITIDRGLAAVAVGDRGLLEEQAAELEERADAVDAANAELAAAVAAQQEALHTCQPEAPPTTTTAQPSTGG